MISVFVLCQALVAEWLYPPCKLPWYNVILDQNILIALDMLLLHGMCQLFSADSTLHHLHAPPCKRHDRWLYFEREKVKCLESNWLSCLPKLIVDVAWEEYCLHHCFGVSHLGDRDFMSVGIEGYWNSWTFQWLLHDNDLKFALQLPPLENSERTFGDTSHIVRTICR